jgi:hypothetical protein
METHSFLCNWYYHVREEHMEEKKIAVPVEVGTV